MNQIALKFQNTLSFKIYQHMKSKTERDINVTRHYFRTCKPPAGLALSQDVECDFPHGLGVHHGRVFVLCWDVVPAGGRGVVLAIRGQALRDTFEKHLHTARCTAPNAPFPNPDGILGGYQLQNCTLIADTAAAQLPETLA